MGIKALPCLLQWQVAPHISNVALPIRFMVFVFVVVTLMTYLVMRRLTVLLRCWLYAS